jgi:hypothetical protein
MRQVVLLDQHDLASLRAGQPLMLQLGNGHALEVGYDGKIVSKPTTPPKAKTPPLLREPVPRLSKCPYCSRRYRSLGPHVRGAHPGKGLVAAGGVKCRFCDKRYPTRNSVFRHEIATHLEAYHKAKKEGEAR